MANLRSLRGGAGPHGPHWGGPHRGGPHRGRPEKGEPHLPAFCRTRRPTTVVSITSLRTLHRLLLLVLLFQLSTLLLVIAGPVPPRVSTMPAPAATPQTAEHQEPRKAGAARKLSAP